MFTRKYQTFKHVQLTSKCSKMYGGLVMPTLIMQPSGITFTSSHSSLGKDSPISRPYAPVSSLVIHISTTPSVYIIVLIQLLEYRS